MMEVEDLNEEVSVKTRALDMLDGNIDDLEMVSIINGNFYY